MKSAGYWIEELQLEPHPEGGYFKETYESTESFHSSALPDRYSSSRPFATSIIFLITSENFSAFHQLKSDEVWHFYDGSTLSLYTINTQGELSTYKLGRNIREGEQLQVIMPHSQWFAGEVAAPNSHALVGCSVSPGFDYDDFILGEKENLCKAFPQHKTIISRLTRS